MSDLTVIQGTPTPIYLADEYPDQGWVFDNNIAKHSGCNPGYFTNRSLPIVIGKTYKITYKISDYKLGVVRIEIGNSLGINRNTNGEFTEEIVATNNTVVRFYASGDVAIEMLKLEVIDNTDGSFATISFNYKDKYWQGWWSYEPDMMANLGTQFFSWNKGQLYKHNVNETRNNFYGVQYRSAIKFVQNMEPKKEKFYWTIKIDSNGRWGLPSITSPANDKFPKGMRSRIKKGNFKEEEGKYWADFFFDLNDPKYFTTDPSLQPARELEALMEARMLQGCTLSIEMENTDTKEIWLSGVYIYTSEVSRNF